MRRFLALLLLAPALLPAQAPAITPAGDPSVRADTIYRLAVDPKDYPEYATAILLDDGVVRVEADGRTTRTYRMVIQLLKPEAEENYQEQQFSYTPGHERLTVNWVRVVRPDGQVVSAEPSHTQDSDVPAQMGDPVYSDRRVRRMSLSGVKAGTIVDWSYTVEDFKPFLRGDFFLSWSVNPGSVVRRSRYIVDAPTSLDLRIVERNLDFRRQTRVADGRRVHTWAKADLPPVRPEALAADSNGVYQTIHVAGAVTWADIGKWYADSARSRYALGIVRSMLDTVVARARTRDDTIRAIHRWVAQDIRYVSIALGFGGYQPRSPEEVVRSGFGDCKDKATLFIASLAAFGIEAFPVLLNSEGGVDRRLASISQLDHAIAAVQLGGKLTYTDLTAELVPYGRIPFSYQGEFGLVIRPTKVEEITFPLDPLETNRTITRVTGQLDEQGRFAGRYEQEAHGAHDGGIRNSFRHPLDSATRANAANGIARNVFEGAVGDSLEGFNGMDLGATVRYRSRIVEAKAADPAGGTMILKLPLPSTTTMIDAARQLEAEPARRFPIDPAQFWGYGSTITEFRVTLPAGWTAVLPKSVSARGDFGSYESEYRQEGRELVVRRRIAGARGVQPPERLGDFIAWLRAIGSDDARLVVLQRSAAAQAGAPSPAPGS